MNHRRRSLACILGAIGLAAATSMQLSPAAALDETLTVVSSDAAAYPDVKLVVAAPPQLGDQILTDSSFWVVESGASRAVRVQPLPADQMEVALVVDTSGSMIGAPLAAAKSAAQSFLSQLPAAVPVSVIGFGSTPKVVSPRSSDRGAQLAAVGRLTASGQTALYDALDAALTQLPTRSGASRVVVLLSDGGDTTSTRTLSATEGRLSAANVPLFAVELHTSDSNPAALDGLTSASAGRVFQASDPAALSGAFGAVAKQLVRQYSVTYSSQAGGETDVDVILDTGTVRAVAHRHLQLPGSAPVPAVTPGPVPARTPSGRGMFASGWALIVGSGLCGLAMFSLLLGALAFRTPRARGLAVAKRRGLAGPADRAENLADSVLRRRGWADPITRALDAAGLETRPAELVVVAVIAMLAVLGGGWLLLSPVAGLLLALVIPVLIAACLNFLAARRRKLFSNQLAEALQLMAGSLRAGHGLAQAIATVAQEAESPMTDEFHRLTVEARLGRDFVKALDSLALRVKSADFGWVVQAIEIQREVGGDLAEVLDAVANTIRERTRVRRQVSALTAEGRISAWVLALLPVGLGGVMAVTNPSYIRPLYTSGTGHVLLAAAAALLAAGGLWLRQIVKPTF